MANFLHSLTRRALIASINPSADLDFNGVPAAKDPGELQIPICQVGTQPTINPPGKIGNPAVTTEPVYVLVPMFSADNDQNPNDAISCNKTCDWNTLRTDSWQAH